jgi:hypothetical protein
MKNFCIVGLALTFLGIGHADITLVSPGSSWYAPVASPVDNGPSSKNQTPGTGAFWDNVSDDGHNCNVGFLLTGETASGSCANAAQGGGVTVPGALSYLGGSTQNSPASSFYFTPNGNSVTVTYMSSNAGYTAASNTSESFGYATYNPISQAIGPATTIFTVSNGTPTTTPVTFTPTSDFVFFIQLTPPWPVGNPQTDPAFTVGTSSQFALFSATPSAPPSAQGTFYLGMKDVINGGPGGLSDLDYNDLVVKVSSQSATTTSSTPEPAFYGALALGLTGLITAVRRRKSA